MGMALVEQAALADGRSLDSPSFLEEFWRPAGVDICRRDFAEALVTPAVVVVGNEVPDGCLECSRQIVVLQQDPVLQCSVPPFYLALRLRVTGRFFGCAP